MTGRAGCAIRTRAASASSTAAFGQPPKIGPRDLWVGDLCGVRAYDRPTVEFEGAGRIFEVTLTGDEDGKVVPQLKTTPSTIAVEAT
jgi:hypothetical protein